MFRRTPKQAAANELGDPTLLAAESIFSAKEIQSLQLRFRRLLQGSDSTIVAARLLHEPEFQCHALAPLLLRHGRLDFDAFLRLLTVLHPTKTSLVAKRSALFHLYDVDADGVVSASDMKSAFQRLRPDGSIDDVLDNDVAAAFHSVPSQSGLSPDAFAQLVSDDDVLAALSFLLAHRHEGCTRDVVVQKALEGCHLHVAEYLLALGYPFPTSTPLVHDDSVILGVLQLLVKHGASWDDDWVSSRTKANQTIQLAPGAAARATTLLMADEVVNWALVLTIGHLKTTDAIALVHDDELKAQLTHLLAKKRKR
ncbi:hypothetical protein SDRG_09822 [Saprolegnia diclina VS20]|uniref:EF-hand domain-containing protein n=1 Tax=Saprolegnia diclina (strain VS20) TaxID=1156394 RepID=T0QCT6_SAPDV|nr:hypothetical protein SDRG_09822 [Saprolegnia diclina VS20]EQC32496.1 hypothetical protein SDRG_09822 [Saprolegnia diclina VS20]|eukprot:XP_008613997.1 hypothetical protein SDRG_09822 [Saprolegnia diclina VS20]